MKAILAVLSEGVCDTTQLNDELAFTCALCSIKAWWTPRSPVHFLFGLR
jgi:hypothetical protein